MSSAQLGGLRSDRPNRRSGAMAEANQDVTRMLDTYTNAVLAKDVEAFV